MAPDRRKKTPNKQTKKQLEMLPIAFMNCLKGLCLGGHITAVFQQATVSSPLFHYCVCPPTNSCLVRSRSEWLSPLYLSWFYRPSSHPLQVAGVVWSWSFPRYLWWSFLLIEIFHFKCSVSVRAPVFPALTYLKYYVGSGATLSIHLHKQGCEMVITQEKGGGDRAGISHLLHAGKDGMSSAVPKWKQSQSYHCSLTSYPPFLKEMKFGMRKVTCFSSRNIQECILADILTTCTSLTTVTWADSFWWLGPHRGCLWNPIENPVLIPLSFITPPPPIHLWNPKVSEKGMEKVQGLKTRWRVTWKRLALGRMCWICCTSHAVWSFS